jgi:threonine dehydrogenase-like Zn-dependent dehydrogenase
MQQLVFVRPRQVEWQEAPEPCLQGPGEALVRPLAVATCDLDGAILQGQAPFAGPFALGHECIARVLEVGRDVTSIAPGDLVVVPFQIACGTCVPCRRGLTATCAAVPRVSMYGLGQAGGEYGGALSDVLRVPFADEMLLPCPPGVSPLALPSAGDNVADGWRAVAPALGQLPGASVLILCGPGSSSIPLYATQMARALDAGRVDVAAVRAQTVDLARSFGADSSLVNGWLKRLGSYDITVDASNDPEGLACAVRSTVAGGVCTSVSIYFDDGVALPLLEMYTKGITFVTGRVNSRAVLPEVLRLIAEQRIDPALVTTETAPWHEAPTALLSYTTKLVLYRVLPAPG